MRRISLAWIAAALVVGAAWLLALAVFVADPSGGRTDAPLPTVERMTYALVDDTHRPTFRLVGGERQLKLVTHVIASEPGPRRPDEVEIYALRLTLVALDGTTLWTGMIYTSGRRSVDPEVEPPMLPDAMLVDEPGRAVLDSRLLQFEIPVPIPPESRLEVAREATRDQVAVRLFAREAPRAGVSFRAKELLDESTLALDDIYDARLPRHMRWIRRNTDAQSVQLDRTGNRRPFSENETKALVPVHPLRPIVLNVEGPSTLEMVLRRGADDAQEEEAADDVGSLAVVDISTRTAIGSFAVGLPRGAGEETLHRFEVPEGIHSLRLSTKAEHGARVRLTTPDWGLDAEGAQRQHRFGDVPRVPYEEREMMLPDERRFPVFLATPDGPRVLIDVHGPDDDLARLVRLDARLLAPSPPLPEAQMTVRYLDADGAQIGERRVRVNPPRAPFEEVELSDGTRNKVSEPQPFRLSLPKGTHTLSVRADPPVAVRPFVLFPTPPPHLGLPYRLHLPPEHIWRYAPREFRIWYPIAPNDRDALRAADKVLTLVAQVRLEPVRRAPDRGEERTPPKEFEPIQPIGRPAQQRVYETVRRDRPPQKWGPGLVSELSLGTPTTVIVKPGERARTGLRILVDGPPARTLGQKLRVSFDGEERDQMSIGASRQRWLLPPMKAGRHTIQVDGAAQSRDLRLLLEREARGVPTYHLRTLYEFTSEPLRLRVPMPRSGRGVTVLALVYARDPAADPTARVQIRIDGGEPRRRQGVPVESFTLGERIEPLPAAREPRTRARLLDRVDQVAGFPRAIPINLGPDLAPGTHDVEVSLLGGKLLWVRFVIAEDLAGPGESARAGTFTEAD